MRRIIGIMLITLLVPFFSYGWVQKESKYTDEEGDALVARLSQADEKIRNLQRQLIECIQRPFPAGIWLDNKRVISIIYYTLDNDMFTAKDKIILKKVADMIKDNENKKYILTVYNENPTEDDDTNNVINFSRIKNVEDYLIRCGVDSTQIKISKKSKPISDLWEMGPYWDGVGVVIISETN